MAAVARSRSRATRASAAPAVVPVAEERSASKQPRRGRKTAAAKTTTEEIVPAAVIPSKGNTGKAIFRVPTFIAASEVMTNVKYFVTVVLPAFFVVHMVLKFGLVAKYVVPYTQQFGEKGQTFALLTAAHVLYVLGQALLPMSLCSRLNQGVQHRLEMALQKVSETTGFMALALLGSIVMQTAPVFYFSCSFVYVLANLLYVLACLFNCEHMARIFSTQVHLAISLTLYDFDKSRVRK